MRYPIILLLSTLLLSAKVHYAKVEPLERSIIKSAVSGTITSVDLSSEGKFADQNSIIQIDDRLDRANLKTSKQSLTLIKETLAINSDILSGVDETFQIKKRYYDRIKSLSTSSKTQIDNALSGYIASKNQLLSTKEKIINLKKQILDMEYKIDMLEDTISKKSISPKGRYIYKLMVRAGEFANPGMPLATVDDLHKAKLVLFLDRDELKGIKKKKIYIDDAETDLEISNIWKVSDEKFISEYRAEIVIEPTYRFSSLLKVEIR